MIRHAPFAFTVLVFGYAFLYLPIAVLIIYSFNESQLVTVWAGFSTKWWGELFNNEAMLRAAWLSLRVALVSATAAALLGLAPDECLMVAAHNGDLAAASAQGFRTAFVPRPAEHGSSQTRDVKAERDWDVIAADFLDLAGKLGC